MEEVPIFRFVSQEQKEIFEGLLNEIGEKCRLLLRYFYYERKRMKEIVALMSFSSEQVAKNRKSNCMKKLRSLVKEKNLTRDFFY